MVHQFHFLQGNFTHFTGKIFIVIQQKDPENIEHGIQAPEIKMLVLMQLQSFLGSTHAHPGLDVDIIIHPGNIGIGVMNDIVLAVPDKAVSAEDIQGESSSHIHPFALAETAMGPVVHDIKSDGRNHTTEQYAFEDGQHCPRSKEYQVCVQPDKRNTQHNCFKVQIKIARHRLSGLIKIGIDPFFEIGVKTVGAARKFRYLHEYFLLLKSGTKVLHF
jgi:hypothetical protein